MTKLSGVSRDYAKAPLAVTDLQLYIIIIIIIIITINYRCVRKISKSDYELRHVCLPVRVGHHNSHWTDFNWICYVGIFRKHVQKIQV